jgi:hypothetical protein
VGNTGGQAGSIIRLTTSGCSAFMNLTFPNADSFKNEQYLRLEFTNIVEYQQINRVALYFKTYEKQVFNVQMWFERSMVMVNQG